MPSAEFREQDPFSPIVYSYPGVTLLHQQRTPYQEIAVLQHPHFGKMLVLDGVVQLTERDEFFYHEMLVHPAMHAHPSPQRVLIIGGGDGGSLREVLKHPGVQGVTLVEIDQGVVEVSRSFFPSLSQGFADPRVQVVYQDGTKLVQQPPSQYDVVIVDSTDPVGPAEGLFSAEFYGSAFRALMPQGILVTQSESLLFHTAFVADVQRRLSQHFPIVDCYAQPLATYAGNWWTFSIASKAHDPRRPSRGSKIPTRYYSPEVHRKAFLPRAIYRRLLAGTLDW